MTPPLRATIHALTVLSGVLLAVLALTVAWRTQEQDRQYEDAAMQRKATMMASLLAEHVERTFGQADLMGRLAADRYLEDPRRLDLGALAASGALPRDVFLQVAVVDARGVLVASTVPGFKAVDLSDRAHIRIHLQGGAPDYFISQPVVGRASGKASIQYSRPIRDGRGALRGVVVISLDPGYFTGVFRSLDSGPAGSVMLVGLDDGVIRARTAREAAPQAVGRTLPADAPALVGMRRGEGGTLRAHSVIDGVDRWFAYRPVGPLPLGVVVGLDVEAHLQPYADRMRSLWTTAIGGAVAALVLAVLNVLLLRRWLRQLERSRAADRSVQTLQRRTLAMADADPDGLLLLDDDRRVVNANSSFLRLAGQSAAAVGGAAAESALQRLVDLHELDGMDSVAPALFDPAPADPSRRLLLRRRSAPSLTLELRAWPLGDGLGYVLSIRDITAQDEIDRLKLEFVTTAAHELRTPMASVMGFSELLMLDALEPQERKDAYVVIHRQAARLTTLLNEFLDLARLDARGAQDFRFEPLDLVAVAEEVAAEFSYIALERAIRVEHDGPVWVNGDRAQLTRVVHNLVSNAIKYSAAPSPVTLRVRTEGSDAVFEVEDHGIGLTPSQKARVFDGFYRADTSGKTVGTGLGLSLSRRIVEGHRGRLTLESEFGYGTTACVRLARVQAPAATTIAAAPALAVALA